MMKFSLTLTGLLALCVPSLHAYLSIDTNDLLLRNSVTNIRYQSIPEPMVPSSYLKTGKIEFQPPETELRRFDIIYFIAVPITFYLTLNVVFFLNSSFIARDPGIPNNVYPSISASPVQFRYVLMNTLLIPLFVAWEDLQYSRQHQPDTTEPPAGSGLNLGMNLISVPF